MRQKIPIHRCALVALAAWALSLTPAKSANVVFSDDFSSSTLLNSGNPFVGGFFNPQLGFGRWTGTREISITTGALQTRSTSGTRSAGIVLSPSLFAATGAGTYTLTFDITAYTGDANDNAIVNIWAGRGQDLTQRSSNALIVNTFNAELVSNGPSTSVDLLRSATYTAPATAIQLTFNYQLGDSIALFLGSQTRGFPFPSTTFDNVSVAFTPPIPEPSTPLLLGTLATLALLRRKR